MPKPSATFTILATWCSFGRSRSLGVCNGVAFLGEILGYFRSDHDVNLICELYSHSCERGKLMWYQGKTP